MVRAGCLRERDGCSVEVKEAADNTVGGGEGGGGEGEGGELGSCFRC